MRSAIMARSLRYVQVVVGAKLAANLAMYSFSG